MKHLIGLRRYTVYDSFGRSWQGTGLSKVLPQIKDKKGLGTGEKGWNGTVGDRSYKRSRKDGVFLTREKCGSMNKSGVSKVQSRGKKGKIPRETNRTKSN